MKFRQGLWTVDGGMGGGGGTEEDELSAEAVDNGRLCVCVCVGGGGCVEVDRRGVRGSGQRRGEGMLGGGGERRGNFDRSCGK